jgi:hypothetical protein
MPGWFAPVLGTVIGVVGGFYEGKDAMGFKPPMLVWFSVATGGIGLAGGLIVWWMDRLRRPPSE